MTMEIHHGKHHAAYVSKLNDAIKGTDAESRSIEEIMRSISSYPMAVRNNGGGHYNHSLFWTLMSPSAGAIPPVRWQGPSTRPSALLTRLKASSQPRPSTASARLGLALCRRLRRPVHQLDTQSGQSPDGHREKKRPSVAGPSMYGNTPIT
jgi:hypothetical protein